MTTIPSLVMVSAGIGPLFGVPIIQLAPGIRAALASHTMKKVSMLSSGLLPSMLTEMTCPLPSGSATVASSENRGESNLISSRMAPLRRCN